MNLDGLFAFWRSDTLPFVCGGHVTRMKENGSVETKEYGKGYFWKPIKLLPAERGVELMRRFEALGKEHREAQRKFDAEWRAKAEKLFAEMGAKL